MADILSTQTNPEGKKLFDIRTVMRAVADRDDPPLERWAALADAESAAATAAHLGGYLGIGSPAVRHGFLPADGPDQRTAGMLFPRSSTKVPGAVNAASGNRSVVIGGAPAAAMVFARDIGKRTDADRRVVELEAGLDAVDDDERARLRAELAEVRAVVRSEKLGEVAGEFDDVSAWSGHCGSARSTPSSLLIGCGRTSSRQCGEVCGEHWSEAEPAGVAEDPQAAGRQPR